MGIVTCFFGFMLRNPRVALWSLLVAAFALLAVAEWAWWQNARARSAQILAVAAATQSAAIDERVREQFENLTLIGKGLLAPYLDGTAPARIPTPIAQALDRVLAEYPELRAINVQTPDGKEILWSTFAQPRKAIFAPDDFRPYAPAATPGETAPLAHEGLLTLPRFAPRFNEAVVGMRLPIRAADGSLVAYVDSPYRAAQLFARAPTLVENAALLYTTTIFDRRFQRVVATLDEKGRVTPIPSASSTAPPSSQSAPSAPPEGTTTESTLSARHCRGAYCVTTAIAEPLWLDHTLQEARPRWTVEGVLLALFIFALTRLQVVHGKLKRALVTQQRLARTDPLTHCPNRYALETIAPNLLAQAGRRNEWVAVGLFDLNDFKPVNDRFGHDVGDALLVTVAERLKAATRTSDFVARLGGDEFVILLTGLTAQGAYAELTAFGERLLRHFAEPFTVGGTTLPISYGIGWALFPQHGEELNTLLRRADEALLALKAQKGQTSETMRIAGEANASFTETAPTIDDPFGPAARQLLAAYTALLQDAAERFTETLLSEITEHPVIGKRLAAQLPDAFAHYRALVARHFVTLLAAEASDSAIAEQAALLGTIHALEGLSLAEALVGYSESERFLQRFLQRQGLRSSEIFRLLYIAHLRIALAERTFLDAMEKTSATYLTLVLRDIPEPGNSLSSWQEALCAAIAKLPGIRFAAIAQPDSDGRFHLVAVSGKMNLAPLFAVFDPVRVPRLDSRRAEGQGLTATAWFRNTISVSDDYCHDPHTTPWHALAIEAKMASFAAVPFVDRRGTPKTLLLIGGRHPYQFSSLWAQQWLHALKRAGDDALAHFDTETMNPLQTAPISVDRAAAIRAAVTSGGVQIAVQPIVDLASGRLVKVEALARLQLGTETLTPAQFLPVLRDDLYPHLFLAVLTAGLAWLRRWDQVGVSPGLSVNLDFASLHHPECSHWVQAALTAHAIPPQRLTLELLENQPLAGNHTIEALAALRQLGVQLAIDDIGSGYSGLVRLAQLPFDVIKIDQILVRQMAHDPIPNLTVIRALARLGEGLERQVIAEGVESPALAETLRAVGVHVAQGYGIARPMPPEQLVGWHDEWRRAPLRVYPDAPLTTPLGALAYQWQVNHERGAFGLEPLAECPITAYLNTYYPDAHEIHAVHATLHEAAERRDHDAWRAASQELLAWLLREALVR